MPPKLQPASPTTSSSGPLTIDTTELFDDDYERLVSPVEGHDQVD